MNIPLELKDVKLFKEAQITKKGNACLKNKLFLTQTVANMKPKKGT